MKRFCMLISLLSLWSLGLFAQTWEEVQVLANPNPATSDLFGNSVSISGNYAIVGAYADDITAGVTYTNAGSACIYHWDGTSWNQLPVIANPDPANNDRFGWSVSIAGDYAAVGASRDNSNSGSVYIFHREGLSWVQQQKLTGTAGSYFGYSVQISGDDILVGTPQINSMKGCAYVYHRDGTSWIQQAVLEDEEGEAGDYFGWSVSISEDYAIVGSIYDDGSNLNDGSAIIFHREGTTWTQQQKLPNPDPADNDYLGNAVAISGEYAIVGDYTDNTTAGSIYFYHLEDASWVRQPKISNPYPSAYDSFGYAISISGDNAIIGANGDDSYHGSTFIYSLVGSTWTLKQNLTASDAPTNGNFGYSVAISGNQAIIGAYNANVNGASGAGKVYIVTKPVSLPVTLSSFCATQTIANKALVSWVTQSENDMNGYYVLRSQSERLEDAMPVSELIAAANSSSSTRYAFTDDCVAMQNTYYYWLESLGLDGVSHYYGPVSITLVPKTDDDDVPVESCVTELNSNFPNPFNPVTSIRYSLADSQPVVITVYNILGQKVRTFNEGVQSSGSHSVTWNGTDGAGRAVASGIYFFRLQAGTYTEVRKGVLMK